MSCKWIGNYKYFETEQSKQHSNEYEFGKDINEIYTKNQKGEIYTKNRKGDCMFISKLYSKNKKYQLLSISK